MLIEDEAPLNVSARRAHVGVALEAADHQGRVLDDFHQDHLCTAGQAAHRLYPFATILAQALARQDHKSITAIRDGTQRSRNK